MILGTSCVPSIVLGTGVVIRLFLDWFYPPLQDLKGFPGGSVVKNLPTNAEGTEDSGPIPGSGRSPGGGNGNPQASKPGPYISLVISENHERICKIVPMSPLSLSCGPSLVPETTTSSGSFEQEAQKEGQRQLCPVTSAAPSGTRPCSPGGSGLSELIGTLPLLGKHHPSMRTWVWRSAYIVLPTGVKQGPRDEMKDYCPHPPQQDLCHPHRHPKSASLRYQAQALSFWMNDTHKVTTKPMWRLLGWVPYWKGLPWWLRW